MVETSSLPSTQKYRILILRSHMRALRLNVFPLCNVTSNYLQYICLNLLKTECMITHNVCYRSDKRPSEDLHRTDY